MKSSFSDKPVFQDSKDKEEELNSIEAILKRYGKPGGFRQACHVLIHLYRQNGRLQIVKEINQTGNERYKAEFNLRGKELGFNLNGVCCGMSLRWIQLVMTGQEAVFQKAIDEHWAMFGCAQAYIDQQLEKNKATRHRLETQRDPVIDYIANYQTSGARAQAQHKKEYERKKQERDQLSAQIDAQKGRGGPERKATKAVYNKVVNLMPGEATNAVYEKFVYLMNGIDLPEGRVREIFDEWPIAEVADFLEMQPRGPAYYFMELDSGEGKHAVAFSTFANGDVKPRFMDPNTCDFRFPRLEVMYQFLSDYFSIYAKTDFRDAKCWVLEFR